MGGPPRFAHVLYAPGDLMGRSHQGLGRAKSPFEAPGAHAQGPGRAGHRLGRHVEGLGGTVARLPRAALAPLAAGDVIFGGSPSQEQTCFSSGHLLLAVPIAESIVWAMEVLISWTATRSTPVIRRRGARVV
jgi:hypothetical protein